MSHPRERLVMSKLPLHVPADLLNDMAVSLGELYTRLHLIQSEIKLSPEARRRDQERIERARDVSERLKSFLLTGMDETRN